MEAASVQDLQPRAVVPIPSRAPGADGHLAIDAHPAPPASSTLPLIDGRSSRKSTQRERDSYERVTLRDFLGAYRDGAAEAQLYAAEVPMPPSLASDVCRAPRAMSTSTHHHTAQRDVWREIELQDRAGERVAASRAVDACE